MCRSDEASAAAAVEETVIPLLCDADCEKSIESLELVTLPSGLQYRDVVVGKGSTPPVGYQVIIFISPPVLGFGGITIRVRVRVCLIEGYAVVLGPALMSVKADEAIHDIFFFSSSKGCGQLRREERQGNLRQLPPEGQAL